MLIGLGVNYLKLGVFWKYVLLVYKHDKWPFQVLFMIYFYKATHVTDFSDWLYAQGIHKVVINTFDWYFISKQDYKFFPWHRLTYIEAHTKVYFCQLCKYYDLCKGIFVFIFILDRWLSYHMIEMGHDCALCSSLNMS